MSSSPESVASFPIKPTPTRVDEPCHRHLERVVTEALKTAEESMLHTKDYHESIDLPRDLVTNTQRNGMPTQSGQALATACKSKASSLESGHKSQSPKALKSDPSMTVAELTAQRAALIDSFVSIPRLASLLHTQGQLPGSISIRTDSGTGALANSSGPPETAVLGAAKDIIAQHIKLLHTYNEIKDIGQGLMGLIADARGVRIVEVQEEFGIGAKD